MSSYFSLLAVHHDEAAIDQRRVIGVSVNGASVTIELNGHILQNLPHRSSIQLRMYRVMMSLYNSLRFKDDAAWLLGYFGGSNLHQAKQTEAANKVVVIIES